MTEKEIRNYMKFMGDLKLYNRYVEYVNKLDMIKNKIFNQVLSHLDCSLDNFSIVLSSDELDFLRKFKNEKI